MGKTWTTDRIRRFRPSALVKAEREGGCQKTEMHISSLIFKIFKQKVSPQALYIITVMLHTIICNYELINSFLSFFNQY